MCGINGIFAYRSTRLPRRDELLATRDYMMSRGPDGCGEWVSSNGQVALAHRRLAIIDLSNSASQPMSSADGRFTVTFNGEIYNYRELRTELEKEGAVFCSHSDTEVLLHLYGRIGRAMVQRLRGMFAFAIWDEREKSLFLARDPYGIKPLYYADTNGTFRFASQVKALLAGKEVSAEIEPAGITGFFLWGSVPEPFTFYKDIRSLPAGHMMTVEAGGIGDMRQYWGVADAISRSVATAEKVKTGEEEDYAREALIGSLKAHMVADVPVGAFLSAGLDSSTVVGLAQELTDHPLQTITLAFDEFKNKSLDEMPAAIEIAKHLGVAHACTTIRMQDVEDELETFFSAMDQPTIDGINTWFVSKYIVEKGLKVALSGLGGDELLGGYHTFENLPRMVDQWKLFQGIPYAGSLYRFAYQSFINPWSKSSSKKAGLAQLGGSYPGAYQIERGVFMPWELKYVLRDEVISTGLERLTATANEHDRATEHLNEFAQVAYLESTRYMRNQLLRDTDWIGMAHSLEIRVPLVDSVLTEALIGLAVTGRLGANKAILPASLKKGLPQKVLERPKTGFTVPIWKWLRKSINLNQWKQIRQLNRDNVHDYNRLAYSVVSRIPGAEDFLRL